MKKWTVLNKSIVRSSQFTVDNVVNTLLKNRGIKTRTQINDFLNPKDPFKFTAKDVGINLKQLNIAIKRIKLAIKNKESIIVYSDYDADGITGGAILWLALNKIGAKVMPYIPHRVNEGYGLSIKGIDAILEKHKVNLIITVDQGITGWEKVAYAQKKGIDVIVTDHHTKPKKLPDCTILHTTKLCGAGVAWFLAKKLISYQIVKDLLELAAIGTIADMVPLTNINRSIVKYGLELLNKTKQIGLIALIENSGLIKGEIKTYHISHILAPRLNAMGRLVHGLDALRLLCTNKKAAADDLAKKLGATNKERQLLTENTVNDALNLLPQVKQKLIFISHKEYNQGVIGLVAGKLTEKYYRPTIVISQGEVYSKASGRSVKGFNLIEAIRSCSELLVDCGGHPMAAGFTVETKKIIFLEKKLISIANKKLTEEHLTKKLIIDLEIPLEIINLELWKKIQDFAPFGMDNFEPIFCSRNVKILEARLIGKENKHLKLLINNNNSLSAIGFNMGEYYQQLKSNQPIDIVYTIDLNEWNGSKKIQLKLRDIHFI